MISVNDIVVKHAAIMPNIIAAHALTGCDTVSSFARISKTPVLKKLHTHTPTLRLGDLSSTQHDITESCTQFVCVMYNQEQGATLSEMRASIFTKRLAGKRHIPPKMFSLPPTRAGFLPHCQRAHYQAAIWKAAGMPSPPPGLNPLDCGWYEQGTILQPVHGLSGELLAPKQVLDLVSCSCKKGCTTHHCTCKKLMLPCTLFCKCKGHASCLNPATVGVALQN